jgi:hypothetical protein
LVELRDQDLNRNAAVAAAKTLEAVSDEQQTRSVGAQTPGVTIRIVNVVQPQPAGRMIDVTPVPEPKDR